MKKIKWIILFSLIFFVSCYKKPDIDIENSWKYKVFYASENKSYEFKSPDFDDSKWNKTEEFPAVFFKVDKKRIEKKGKFVIWHRCKVVIPEKYKGVPLSIFLGKIWDQEYTYLNGVRIGSSGKEYPDFHSTWNHSTGHFLPDGLIKYGEENIIVVRHFTNQQANFNGRPFIAGTHQVKAALFWDNFFSESLPMTLGILTFVLGSIMLVIFFTKNGRNKKTLIFSVTTLLWFVLTTHFWLPDYMFMPWNMQDRLFYVLTAFLVGLIYFYIEMSLNEKLLWGRILVFIDAIAVIALSVTATESNPITGWRFDIIGPLGVLIQILWGYVIIKSMLKKNSEAKFMFFGYIFFLAAIGHDALMMNRVIMSSTFYTNIAYPIFLLSFVMIHFKHVSIMTMDLKQSTEEIQEKNKNLEYVFGKVLESADELKSITNTVTDEVTSLNDEMNQQAAALEETSSVIDELSVSIENVSTNSHNQEEEVTSTNNFLHDYEESLKRITDASRSTVKIGDMSKKSSSIIAERLDNVKDGMIKLKESSNSIEEIAVMINNIAEQTNLLSLNAAIEAARAGDHGKGFAVVADEIGKLADNSVEQSRTIQNIVKEIVDDIEKETDIIIDSSKSVSDINESINVLTDSGEKILELCINQEELTSYIKRNISGILEGASTISISSQEQTSAMSEVQKTVNMLSEVMEKVNSGSEDMIRVAKQLEKRVDVLNGLLTE